MGLFEWVVQTDCLTSKLPMCRFCLFVGSGPLPFVWPTRMRIQSLDLGWVGVCMQAGKFAHGPRDGLSSLLFSPLSLCLMDHLQVSMFGQRHN